MSFWESAGGSSLISAGAGILGGAFGGDGISRMKRGLREQYKYQARYNPMVIAANIKGTVEGAKAAGIHPLVAMGANMGGGPAVQIPGQAGGSAGSNAMQEISKHFSRMSQLQAEKDLIKAQAEASRARALENSAEATNEKAEAQADLISTLKDRGSAVVGEEETRSSAGLVAVEPNKQRTRSKADSSVAAGSNPAWMKVEIWPGTFVDVPWSEEGFAESMDSLPAVVATVVRNTGIGYQKAYRLLKKKLEEYHNRPGTGSAGSKAINKRKKKRWKPNADIFIPYPRGPHR